MEECGLGQTLALLLSKREMPDTSRKPRGRGTVLCQHRTLTAEGWGPGLTLPRSWGIWPDLRLISAYGDASHPTPKRFPTACF